MAAAPTFESIKKSLRQRQYAPVYFFHGEEGFFIDELAAEMENILPDDEKVFNQYILYAPQIEPARVIEQCRSIPMMSERQVVVLKEAQAWKSGNLAKLIPYLENPTPSTIFAVCCRGASVKGKELTAALKKGNAVVFESAKIRDYNLLPFIDGFIRERGLNADPKALEMLRDFVGSDLSRLYNEVDKLAGLLPPNATVTPEAVERNVGVSKEYNTFELTDALVERNATKVFRCLAYFRSNPKANPLVMVTAAVFNLFSDLLAAYYAPGGTDAAITQELGLKNPYALKRIRRGMANYNAMQLVEIISAIRRYDVQSKGVGSRQGDQQLFYDLCFHILSAPGRL